MRLLSIFGTRPEAVKMAPILRALAAEPGIDSRVCVTGQHRELLDGVLTVFGIVPDMDLDLMERGQTLSGLLARSVERIDAVLAEEAPDRILVQGDTTTAYAAALAAHHRRIPVAHVEAGLRTYAAHPWPEEANRRGIALLADLHFAPTPGAAANLAAERIAGRVVVTGNSGIDALHLIVAQLPLESASGGRRQVLVTGHRRESFGAPFQAICAALRAIAQRGDVDILYPVHPNPNVLGPVTAALGGIAGIRLVPPLDLAPFVAAMRRADLILTDSGGVQEEAVTLGKPILVLRETTERPEGVAAGLARLVGTDPARIVAEANALLDNPPPLRPSALYGDGRAAARIVDALLGREVDGFLPRVTHEAGSASAAAWNMQTS